MQDEDLVRFLVKDKGLSWTTAMTSLGLAETREESDIRIRILDFGCLPRAQDIPDLARGITLVLNARGFGMFPSCVSVSDIKRCEWEEDLRTLFRVWLLGFD